MTDIAITAICPYCRKRSDMPVHLDHVARLMPGFVWAKCDFCFRHSTHWDPTVYEILTALDEQYIPVTRRP